MMFIRSKLIGFGHCLPAKILTNDDLSHMVETSDEWIRSRTGIRSRHIAETETTSVIAGQAVANAINDAGLKPEDVDLLILASITPDNTTPSTAVKIAGNLGFRSGVPAFDISAACSGFVYALTLADNMIRLGQVKTAVIAGAECLSKIVDWQDRNTCVLFGDGAGAVVLQAEAGTGQSSDIGVLSTHIYADGAQYDYLKTTSPLKPSNFPLPSRIIIVRHSVYVLEPSSVPNNGCLWNFHLIAIILFCQCKI